MDYQFNMPIMEYLAQHRSVSQTQIFLAFSNLGEIQGYILVSLFIYVIFDKRLAVRLAILVALTMSLNHVLKILIGNPRPFIQQGNYLQKWAVPIENARELATEYSTPSGHAMAASSFYSFLYALVRNRYVRVLAVLTIVLTGISRPYLGVHFVEDILLGWTVGLGVGLLAAIYADRISEAWHRRGYAQRIVIAVAGSLALWLATVAINGWRVDGQPRAFVGYAGTFTGIIAAYPLELRFVNFDPRSSSVAAKITRFLISVALAIFTLRALGMAFHSITDDFSILGYLLQYLRYCAVGFVGIFAAPWVFTKFGLAKRIVPTDLAKR